jgi:hypothetical protein
MSTPESAAVIPAVAVRPRGRPLHEFRGMRALAWNGDVLFASRGYTLLYALMGRGSVEWQSAGAFRPALWRNISARSRLSARLFRDGFHALAMLPNCGLVAAVPGAIISMAPGETEFRVSHEIQRGTRPLHITATPQGRIYWGEYFDNPGREQVHIYASDDGGFTWEVAHTFPEGAIRHVHNIVFDKFENCLWILTGDEGKECRILRSSLDLKTIETVVSGNQQARAVALVSTRTALYFATDTPYEQNHVYRLGRNGAIARVARLSSSSIYGCQVGTSILFSTMAEPSRVNVERAVKIYRSPDGEQWNEFLEWKKDSFGMRWFQYGNALLPDGNNTTDLLAASTVAVSPGDMRTSIWRI